MIFLSPIRIDFRSKILLCYLRILLYVTEVIVLVLAYWFLYTQRYPIVYHFICMVLAVFLIVAGISLT